MQVDKSPFAHVWNNPMRLTDPDGMHLEMEKEDENKFKNNGASNYYELGEGTSISRDGSVSGYAKNVGGDNGFIKELRKLGVYSSLVDLQMELNMEIMLLLFLVKKVQRTCLLSNV